MRGGGPGAGKYDESARPGKQSHLENSGGPAHGLGFRGEGAELGELLDYCILVHLDHMWVARYS